MKISARVLIAFNPRYVSYRTEPTVCILPYRVLMFLGLRRLLTSTFDYGVRLSETSEYARGFYNFSLVGLRTRALRFC